MGEEVFPKLEELADRLANEFGVSLKIVEQTQHSPSRHFVYSKSGDQKESCEKPISVDYWSTLELDDKNNCIFLYEQICISLRQSDKYTDDKQIFMKFDTRYGFGFSFQTTYECFPKLKNNYECRTKSYINALHERLDHILCEQIKKTEPTHEHVLRDRQEGVNAISVSTPIYEAELEQLTSEVISDFLHKIDDAITKETLCLVRDF